MQTKPTIKPSQTRSHFSFLASGMSPSDYQVPSSVSVSLSSSSSSSCPSSTPGSLSQAHDAGRSSHKRKAGRKKFTETRHPVYKGVRERNGKWVCELRQPKKMNRMWLGTFPCPEMAATAYDVAVLTLMGNSASFNFPDSVSQLPRSASSSIKDIRTAALKSIQAFEAKKKEEEKEKEKEEKLDSDPRSRPFVDEEELFNMPTLLESMAEGLMLTPPALKKGFNWSSIDDEEEFTLWTLD